jgi:yecA family protein
VNPTAPASYDALRELLTRTGFVLALPELHGCISGVLCSGGDQAAQRWLNEILLEHDGEFAGRDGGTDELAQALHELARATAKELIEIDLRFAPLLPDEDSPLEEQVQALALWCHGFLVGLAFGATRPVDLEGSELREILADFAEISRAGLDEDESEDPDKAAFALAELAEYVRVSVQIVFEDLRSKP